MITLTKQQRIDTTPERFRSLSTQYPDRWGVAMHELLRLQSSDKLDEQSIADVIGNKSWTRLTCTECWKECDIVVIIGQSSEYLCKSCVEEAMCLLDESIDTQQQKE